jgi:hypothetical protein
MTYATLKAEVESAKGDAEALYRVATELLGVLRFMGHAPSEKAMKRPVVEQAKATWLTPVAAAWDKEMGDGTFPFGPAAKALAPLYRKGQSPDEIGKRLGYYLRSLSRRNELKFYSLPKFASTFNQWNPDDPAFSED